MLRRFAHSTFGLVSITGAAFAGAVIVIGAAAYELTHEAVELQLDHRITIETNSLLAEASQGGIGELIQSIRRRTQAPSTASLDYLLVDEMGERLAGTIEARIPDRDYEEFLAYRRGETAGVAQALTTQVPGGTLVVAADRAGLYELDSAIRRLFGLAGAGVLGAGLLVAFLIAWLTRRRLSAIDSTARAIISGDHASRIPRDQSGSEFDRLAETLNTMLSRNAALLDNLRQVSSDVAHDLRTPLMRLCSKLDRALNEHHPEERSAAISAAREEAGELLDIFAALLRIAEVEADGDRIKREPVDLSLLVAQMGETYLPDFEAVGRNLEWQVEKDISILGDKRLLSQAIANLLDNVLRHSRSSSAGRISIVREQNFVVLSIFDDSPEFIGHSASHLLRRFARSESSRSQDGHGLGLALVAAIAVFHGGRAEILTDEGFNVQMWLATSLDT